MICSDHDKFDRTCWQCVRSRETRVTSRRISDAHAGRKPHKLDSIIIQFERRKRKNK